MIEREEGGPVSEAPHLPGPGKGQGVSGPPEFRRAEHPFIGQDPIAGRINKPELRPPQSPECVPTNDPQGIQPIDELMDFLRLPRDAKLDFWQACVNTMPPEFWGEMLEREDKPGNHGVRGTKQST